MCSMQRTTKRNRHTAAEAYAARHTECRQLMERIGKQLEAHQARQAQEPANWGFAGDLDYIAEQLAYVLAHLGDRSLVDEKKLTY